MHVATMSWDAWDDDDGVVEAADPTITRARRAAAAAKEILADRYSLERTTVQLLLTRLTTLRTSLQARVFGEAGGVTDFRRFTAAALIADVDDLIATATRSLAQTATQSIDSAASLGEQHADQPIVAAQLTIKAQVPGLDSTVVTAAFDNTADMLTDPMQQFRAGIVQGIRRVATAGDNRQDEINKLRDKISGAGFDNAAYRAERIVRTEIGRIFNMATAERLKGLASEFPFLKKGWRATRDNRTRLGHREAHQTYSRGNGIAIADRFVIRVYKESPGKSPILMGVAQLRFPVDPQATPQGRLSAAATIMCRCGSFVDFDIAHFQQFAKAKVALALGDLRGTIPEPPPTPVVPKKVPAVRQPKLPKIKPLPLVVPGQVVGKAKPHGQSVAALVKVTQDKAYAKVQDAINIIDKVHGTGNLDPIQMGKSLIAKKHLYGYYQPGAKHSYKQMRAAAKKGVPISDIGITGKGLASHPYNTTFHETGHWLDHMGLGTGKVNGSGTFGSDDLNTPAWKAWQLAAKTSPTIQRLNRWQGAAFRPVPGMKPPMQADPVYGHQGDGDTPMGVNRTHLAYLNTSTEVWARAYAQYIAVKGGNAPALAELRRMQQAATYGPVKADQRYNNNPMGKTPIPDTWDYPVVWQDDEFEPISKAIDGILEEATWRSAGAK